MGSPGVESEVPMAAPPSARSSAWFCTGASAGPNTVADGTVVIANAGSTALSGTATVVSIAGAARVVPLAVPQRGRSVLRLADAVTGPWVSAVVELDGGDAAVELAVAGPFGESVTPCASSASATWHVATGVTTKDAVETLLVFNPFPEDAVVDFSFASEGEVVTPEGLTGASVPGRGMTAVDVGRFVQRRDAVASTVRARSGRLVVARAQTFDGTAGPKGMTVTLGSAAPGSRWHFPEGRVADGVTERFLIFNPGAAEARVELAVALESGQAEPIQISVPRQSAFTVVANDETRIPKGTPHAVTVRAVNGVGVVVERTVVFGPPSGRSGVATMVGSRVTTRRWALAVGQSDDAVDELVVLQNPGARPVRVSIAVLDEGVQPPAPGLADLEVPAGGRRAVPLGDNVKGLSTPLVVTSNAPVVVERDTYRRKGLGATMAIGVPLR